MGKRKVSVKSDADDEVTAKLLKTTSTDVDKKLGRSNRYKVYNVYSRTRVNIANESK